MQVRADNAKTGKSGFFLELNSFSAQSNRAQAATNLIVNESPAVALLPPA
jgi:hypothetical protein